MSKSFQLFEAHGISQWGSDPIIRGINAKRLGVPISNFMSYTNSYGEEFFEGIIFGYENAFNEEVTKDLKPMFHGSVNTVFIMKQLMRHKLLTGSFSNIKFELDNSFMFRLTTSIINKSDKYPIEFNIKYVEHICCDGSSGYHWHVDFRANHSVIQTANDYRFNMEDVNIDDVKWRGGISQWGSDGCSGWYELSDEKSITMHSSNVAKLIDFVTKKLVERYNIPEKTTLGQTARIVKSK